MSIAQSFAVVLRGAYEAQRPTRREFTTSAPMFSSPMYAQPDSDESAWTLLSNGGNILGSRGKMVEPAYRIRIRQECRKAARFNPHGRAVVRSFVKFALGRNCRPRWGDAMDKDDNKREALERFWRVYSYAWRWNERSKEVAVRFLRDGENFIRRFSDTVPVYLDGKKVMRKMLLPRTIDPELIRDPTSQSEEGGIVTRPGDIETIEAYLKAKVDDLSTIDARIPAADMIHVKVEADMNELRGLPMMASVVPFIRMYDAWMMDRVVLNRVRSSVAIVRTFDGSGGQMKAALDRENSSERNSSRGGFTAAGAGEDVRMKRFRPGTMINASKGVDYKFISPNLQAADVQHDGRSMLLAIAAGTGLAEFMISGDLGSGSYGSLLVSDGPVEKEAKDFQGLLAMTFTQMLTWAVEYEREFNKNTLGIPEDFDPTSVDWEFARVVVRSRLHETQANATMVQLGLMSRETAMQQDGLEYSQEQSRMEAEVEDYKKIALDLPKMGGSASIMNDPNAGNGDGKGGEPGQGRNRGPSDGDPNDHRATDPAGTPSNASLTPQTIQALRLIVTEAVKTAMKTPPKA